MFYISFSSYRTFPLPVKASILNTHTMTVTIHLKALPATPSLKQPRFKCDASQNFEYVVRFLRRRLKVRNHASASSFLSPFPLLVASGQEERTVVLWGFGQTEDRGLMKTFGAGAGRGPPERVLLCQQRFCAGPGRGHWESLACEFRSFFFSLCPPLPLRALLSLDMQTIVPPPSQNLNHVHVVCHKRRCEGAKEGFSRRWLRGLSLCEHG